MMVQVVVSGTVTFSTDILTQLNLELAANPLTESIVLKKVCIRTHLSPLFSITFPSYFPPLFNQLNPVTFTFDQASFSRTGTTTCPQRNVANKPFCGPLYALPTNLDAYEFVSRDFHCSGMNFGSLCEITCAPGYVNSERWGNLAVCGRNDKGMISWVPDAEAYQELCAAGMPTPIV
jgi:hypothetical protein